MGRRDFLRRRDFFNLRIAILLRGPLRWFKLLKKGDWDDSSLELSAVETEPQESSLGTGLGESPGLDTSLDTALGDVAALGKELCKALWLGTELGTVLGKSPRLCTKLGTGLGTGLGTALGKSPGLGTEVDKSAGLGTKVGTGLGEPTLLSDIEWRKRYSQLLFLYLVTSFLCWSRNRQNPTCLQ